MPVNFPNSPTVGELFVTNGKTYQWDGEKWTTDTTVTKTDIGLSNVQNYSVANQAEAEAGVLDNLYMTPLKTAQSINALSPAPTIASQAEAEAGTDNTVFMTPLKTAQAIEALAVGNPLVTAPTINIVSKGGSSITFTITNNYNDDVYAEWRIVETGISGLLEILNGQTSDSIVAGGLTAETTYNLIVKIFKQDAVSNHVVLQETTTSFTIDNLSYNGVFIQGGSNNQQNLQGLTFNNNGTKLYTTDVTAKGVHQYGLSVPYDLSTVNLVFEKNYINNLTIYDIQFNNDGTKMFLITEIYYIREYTLSTPYDVSTATEIDSINIYNDAPVQNFVRSFSFNSTGTVITFATSNNSQNRFELFKYTLSTPFDLSTANYSTRKNLLSYGFPAKRPRGVRFNSNGSKMYVMEDYYFIHQFNLSTAYDINSMSYDNIIYTNPVIFRGFHIDDSSSKLYAATSSSTVLQYSISTPSNIGTTSSTSDAGFYVRGLPSADDLHFINNGTKIIAFDRSQVDGFMEFTLPTAYSLDGAVYSGPVVSNLPDIASKYCFDFNDDGTKVYLGGYGGSANGYCVSQYSLSTPYDLSTITFDNVRFNVDTEMTNFRYFRFSNDGLKFFGTGINSDAVFEYTMTTPYDISSATYSNKSLYVGNEDTNPYALGFNNDGSKMFVYGASTDSVYQYSLPTPFDLSGATYDNLSVLINQTGTMLSLDFSPDGSKMIVGGGDRSIYEYDL